MFRDFSDVPIGKIAAMLGNEVGEIINTFLCVDIPPKCCFKISLHLERAAELIGKQNELPKILGELSKLSGDIIE